MLLSRDRVVTALLKCLNRKRTSIIFQQPLRLCLSPPFKDLFSCWVWEWVVMELQSCLPLRAGQLLYGPITLCPAGEQKPGEKWSGSRCRESIFFHAAPKLLLKVDLTADRGLCLGDKVRGFVLKRRSSESSCFGCRPVVSDHILHYPLIQLLNPQTPTSHATCGCIIRYLCDINLCRMFYCPPQSVMCKLMSGILLISIQIAALFIENIIFFIMY